MQNYFYRVTAAVASLEMTELIKEQEKDGAKETDSKMVKILSFVLGSVCNPYIWNQGLITNLYEKNWTLSTSEAFV